MRPLEILLSLANLLLFGIFVIPRLGAIRWTGYFAPVTVLIACVQLLVEGPRWQIVPAYTLTLIFFLIWLFGILPTGGIPVNRFIAGVGIGVGAFALVVSVVLPIVLPVFHFPRPSGPYRIGTVTYHWTEPRHEIFSADPNAHRELVVQVWYPAGDRITGWTRDPMQPLIDQSLSPVEQAPILNGDVLGEGIIPYFAYDVSFVLDRLTALDSAEPEGLLAGRPDLQRVGIFGVSLGAMVAAEAAHRDPRIQAALMMDAAMPAGVAQTGLRQPGMWITRDAGTMRLERERAGSWSEADIALTLNTMREAFNKSLLGDGYYVQVPGMFHINFTDAPYWSPLLRRLGLVGPIEAQRAFDIVNAYSLAFFGRYLGETAADLFDGLTKQYPDVQLEESS